MTLLNEIIIEFDRKHTYIIDESSFTRRKRFSLYIYVVFEVSIVTE